MLKNKCAYDQYYEFDPVLIRYIDFEGISGAVLDHLFQKIQGPFHIFVPSLSKEQIHNQTLKTRQINHSATASKSIHCLKWGGGGGLQNQREHHIIFKGD